MILSLKAAIFGIVTVFGVMWWTTRTNDWTVSQETREFYGRSPLVADLPGNLKASEREFQRRITERFPVGSSETDLGSTLSEQGFKAYDSSRDKLGRIVFRLERTDFPCNFVWHVIAKSQDGSITEVSANHGAICP